MLSLGTGIQREHNFWKGTVWGMSVYPPEAIHLRVGRGSEDTGSSVDKTVGDR